MHGLIHPHQDCQQLQQAAMQQSCHDFFPLMKGSSFIREDLRKEDEGSMSVLWDYVILTVIN
jgi:hypothetical protein